MNDMNDIKHHLNDELLLGYSAGALPEAFNLIVATHLEMCDKCRVIKRHGKIMVICPNPKHKQRQG